LRLQEGITDLKLEQQLAPARETLSNALAAGSTGFFRAVEGVKGGINRFAAQRRDSSSGQTSGISGSTAASDAVSPASAAPSVPTSPPPTESKLRPLSLVSTRSAVSTTSTTSSMVDTGPSPVRSSIASWGSGLGSFISSKASRFSVKGINLGGGGAQQASVTDSDEGKDKDKTPPPPSSLPLQAGITTGRNSSADEGLQTPSTSTFVIQPRDLDEQPRTPVTAKPTATAVGYPPPSQGGIGYAE
jgi:hypothetical protein